MHRVHLTNERCDVVTKLDREANLEEDADNGANASLTTRRLAYKSQVEWWYRSGTEWLLWWCVVGSVSKGENNKPEDTRPMPSRIDSGIGFHIAAEDAKSLLQFEEAAAVKRSIPLDPISLVFHFEDGTYTKTIAYGAFARWKNVSALLEELGEEGIIVDQLWDVNEDMRIGGGDWDARVKPGCVIDVWCFSDRGSQDWVYDCSSDSADDADEEGPGDVSSELCVARGVRNEHPWWFARWKERVEKETAKNKELMREPS